MKKKNEPKIWIAVAVFMALLTMSVFVGSASASTIYVPDNYTKIQLAVDNATVGSTIIVRDGTYTENVNVNVDNLTIQSENGSDSTIVQAKTNDHVFEVTADYVNISGFTAKGTTKWYKASGIYLGGVGHCNITNNIISDNYRGIYFDSSNSNTILDNCFENDGIFIEGEELSHYNTHTIEGNTVNGKSIYYYKDTSGMKVPEDAGEVILANCTEMTIENIDASNGTVGIELAYTTDSEISNNIISSNTWCGIYLDCSSGNRITNNTASNNYYGIYLYYSSNYNILTNNTANSNRYGIFLQRSSSNTLTNNTANSNHGIGIYLYYSSNNTFTNNTANSNHDGIELYWHSNNNNLTNNIANSNNGDGILLAVSSNNTLTNNAAMENTGFDLRIYASSDSDCNNRIENMTGSANKPILYYNSSVTLENDDNISILILANADDSQINNVTVKGSDSLKNNGILLVRTDNSNISNSNSSNNYYGIRLDSSSNNTLTNNAANSNYGDGIYLQYSSNNNLTNNTANSNNHHGISLY